MAESSPESLQEILSGLEPTAASYLKAAREIEKSCLPHLDPFPIALLSTFTVDPLKPYLLVEGARRGLGFRVNIGPYNQIEQQAFDSKSDLYRSLPRAIVIAARLEDLAPELVHRFLSLKDEEVGRAADGVVNRLQEIIRRIRSNSAAPVLIFNFPPLPYAAAGLADPMLALSQQDLVSRLNARLVEICRTTVSTYLCDYSRLISEFGLSRWTDPKLYFLGRIPFRAEAQLETSKLIARYCGALATSPCKCLVLDLDNTLWGGVLGEEGAAGIALGEDYPGNVFKDFQKAVLTLRDRGILLAIASKNNPSDVEDCFRGHPDLLLRWDYFSAREIHWNDKAQSLRRIASALNIGTDALAFFDDNPAERAFIRSQMPEVKVIDVPPSPLGYVQALHHSGLFDFLTLSREDLQRASLYLQDQERQTLQVQATTLDDFLAQLQMKASVDSVGPQTLPRVAQLLAKTNQFNLTTRRHNQADLEAMIKNGAIALWLRVSDRFGDNGLVGVAIARPDKGHEWTIDSFLLSCRVIGRRVETALLSALSQVIRQRGGKTLVGEFIPTAKNAPAAEFYLVHGFVPFDDDKRFWKWDLDSQGPIPSPSLIELNLKSENPT